MSLSERGFGGHIKFQISNIGGMPQGAGRVPLAPTPAAALSTAARAAARATAIAETIERCCSRSRRTSQVGDGSSPLVEYRCVGAMREYARDEQLVSDMCGGFFKADKMQSVFRAGNHRRDQRQVCKGCDLKKRETQRHVRLLKAAEKRERDERRAADVAAAARAMAEEAAAAAERLAAERDRTREAARAAMLVRDEAYRRYDAAATRTQSETATAGPADTQRTREELAEAERAYHAADAVYGGAKDAADAASAALERNAGVLADPTAAACAALPVSGADAAGAAEKARAKRRRMAPGASRSVKRATSEPESYQNEADALYRARELAAPGDGHACAISYSASDDHGVCTKQVFACRNSRVRGSGGVTAGEAEARFRAQSAIAAAHAAEPPPSGCGDAVAAPYLGAENRAAGWRTAPAPGHAAAAPVLSAASRSTHSGGARAEARALLVRVAKAEQIAVSCTYRVVVERKRGGASWIVFVTGEHNSACVRLAKRGDTVPILDKALRNFVASQLRSRPWAPGEFMACVQSYGGGPAVDVGAAPRGELPSPFGGGVMPMPPQCAGKAWRDLPGQYRIERTHVAAARRRLSGGRKDGHTARTAVARTTTMH